MKNVNNVIKFGEDVEGYTIPVLNEREIRASAGIMFLALFSALVLIMFKQDFLLVKYVIVIFLTDFIKIIRVVGISSANISDAIHYSCSHTKFIQEISIIVFVVIIIVLAE